MSWVFNGQTSAKRASGAMLIGCPAHICVLPELTNWGRDKMDAISQTTFSNAFSWMKMHEFRLRFHWSLFQRFELAIFQHWFRYWLGAGQATSHYLNQWMLVYWRIYASLGLNELNVSSLTLQHNDIYIQCHGFLTVFLLRPALFLIIMTMTTTKLYSNYNTTLQLQLTSGILRSKSLLSDELYKWLSLNVS